MKEKYAKAFMRIAEVFSETSTAERLKVGCVIVKNDTIIALGVNGQPPGWVTEKCEDSENKTLPTVRHAEDAALQKLWNSAETSSGSILFVTHAPCINCAIKIFTAKVSKVYYKNQYRDNSGLDYLKLKNIQIEKYD